MARPRDAARLKIEADPNIADHRVAEHTVATADVQVDMGLQVQALACREIVHHRDLDRAPEHHVRRCHMKAQHTQQEARG
jgi:hypothetical protein